MNECVKFRGCFTLQANATVRPRDRVHEALMKSIGRCEFTPESHRVTNITSWNVGTGFGRLHAIALKAETVGTGDLISLFPLIDELPSLGRDRVGANAT